MLSDHAGNSLGLKEISILKNIGSEEMKTKQNKTLTGFLWEGNERMVYKADVIESQFTFIFSISWKDYET